jgi:hypothetical protein
MVGQRPAQLEAFNNSMAASVARERSIYDKGFASVFPFEAELAWGSPEDTVPVDVGGGYGQVLEDIRTNIPSLKGKMVLEDLPKTIERAKELENLDKVAYDFFNELQPVVGK